MICVALFISLLVGMYILVLSVYIADRHWERKQKQIREARGLLRYPSRALQADIEY